MVKVLIDFSQIAISNIMRSYYNDPDSINDRSKGVTIIRHMIFNSLRRINVLMRSKYQQQPEIIICCDSKDVWRNDIFPLYKAVRRKSKTIDQFDWGFIDQATNMIADEIDRYMPYKVIKVDRLEADDVIAAIVRNSPEQKIVIVSRDKDLSMLIDNHWVEQYNPIDDRWIECSDPERHRLYLVLHGDSGDGVPNILSDDDTFINESKRQKPFGEVKIFELLAQSERDIPMLLGLIATKKNKLDQQLLETVTSNYKRNLQLIDLNQLPQSYVDAVAVALKTAPSQPRNEMLNYFIKYDMRGMTSLLHEF